jgi:hypothetical protein
MVQRLGTSVQYISHYYPWLKLQKSGPLDAEQTFQ